MIPEEPLDIFEGALERYLFHLSSSKGQKYKIHFETNSQYIEYIFFKSDPVGLQAK